MIFFLILSPIFMINPKNQNYSNLLNQTRPRCAFDHKPKILANHCPMSQCSKTNLNSPSCPATTLVCPDVPCPAPVLRPSPLHLHTLCLKCLMKNSIFQNKQKTLQWIDARPWSDSKNVQPTIRSDYRQSTKSRRRIHINASSVWIKMH